MSRYETIYEWSLKDLLEEGYNTTYASIISFVAAHPSLLTLMNNVMGVTPTASTYLHLSFMEYENSQWNTKDYVDDLYERIVRRFFDFYCAMEKEDDIQTALIHFYNKFINILDMTYEKYAAILKSYYSVQSTLMASVKAGTTAEVGYNDTPQEEGGFTDNKHKTSYTKTETESYTDGATPAERLNEIQSKIRNIWLDWSNEFYRLFWVE